LRRSPVLRTTIAIFKAEAVPMALKKIPKSGEFSDVFGRHNSSDYVSLRRSMNLVQVAGPRRLRHESTNTFFQGAISHQIRMNGVAGALTAK
jgi:hypothetical protein